MSKLILASKSPRRRELMEKLRVPFSCEPAKGEEIIPAGTPVEKVAGILSRQKAEEVFHNHPGEDVTVIGSDTIVVNDGVIYGKPKTEADAAKMLKSLSGKTHQVLTGVTIRTREKTESFTSKAFVSFFDLSEEQIGAYIATGEPMDKAGAYGIQGQGALLVEKINGDFYTVMGFPIGEVARRLQKAGIITWET